MKQPSCRDLGSSILRVTKVPSLGVLGYSGSAFCFSGESQEGANTSQFSCCIQLGVWHVFQHREPEIGSPLIFLQPQGGAGEHLKVPPLPTHTHATLEKASHIAERGPGARRGLEPLKISGQSHRKKKS